MATRKPSGEGISPEELDQRLELVRDSIELRVRRETEILLKERFETTGKILGWSFSIVAVVFALLGIKTMVDVREVARTAAIDEVKRKLALDDPQSEFRRDIDKVMARGLVDSYLLSITQAKGEPFGSNLRLPESDYRRLSMLIDDPETSVKDFQDALTVIVASERASEDERTQRHLVQLATGVEPSTKWIASQADKRAALFDEYGSRELLAAAKAVLESSKSEGRLLISVLRFMETNADAQSQAMVEAAAESGENEVRDAARLTLARIAPQSRCCVSSLMG